MRRIFFASTVVVAFFVAVASVSAFDEFELWPGVAPGEKDDAIKPTYEYWKPAEKTSDVCMIVCPVGAYEAPCTPS